MALSVVDEAAVRHTLRPRRRHRAADDVHPVGRCQSAQSLLRCLSLRIPILLHRPGEKADVPKFRQENHIRLFCRRLRHHPPQGRQIFLPAADDHRHL